MPIIYNDISNAIITDSNNTKYIDYNSRKYPWRLNTTHICHDNSAIDISYSPIINNEFYIESKTSDIHLKTNSQKKIIFDSDISATNIAANNIVCDNIVCDNLIFTNINVNKIDASDINVNTIDVSDVNVNTIHVSDINVSNLNFNNLDTSINYITNKLDISLSKLYSITELSFNQDISISQININDTNYNENGLMQIVKITPKLDTLVILNGYENINLTTLNNLDTSNIIFKFKDDISLNGDGYSSIIMNIHSVISSLFY